MVKDKISKEMMGIIKAIEVYCKKHDYDVVVTFSACAFDKKGDVIDDRIIQLGRKDLLLIDAEEITKQANELEDD